MVVQVGVRRSCFVGMMLNGNTPSLEMQIRISVNSFILVCTSHREHMTSED